MTRVPYPLCSLTVRALVVHIAPGYIAGGESHLRHLIAPNNTA
jgi:hypothetical protein